jgi:hypothetical protein
MTDVAHSSDDCPECPAAEAYARKTGAWVMCDGCGARIAVNLRAARRAAQAARRDDERDVDIAKDDLVRVLTNLARWPDLWGAPGFAPALIVGDGNKGGGAKREASEINERYLDERASRERARTTKRRLDELEVLAAAQPGYYALAYRTCRTIVESCGDAQIKGIVVGGKQVGRTLAELLGRRLATTEQLVLFHRAVDRGDSGAARAGLTKLGDDAHCLATAIWLGLL